MIRLLLALALGASAQTRISLTLAARQPTLTTDDVEQLLAVAQRPVTPQGLVIVERTEYQVEDPGGFVVDAPGLLRAAAPADDVPAALLF